MDIERAITALDGRPRARVVWDTRGSKRPLDILPAFLWVAEQYGYILDNIAKESVGPNLTHDGREVIYFVLDVSYEGQARARLTRAHYPDAAHGGEIPGMRTRADCAAAGIHFEPLIPKPEIEAEVSVLEALATTVKFEGYVPVLPYFVIGFAVLAAVLLTGYPAKLSIWGAVVAFGCSMVMLCVRQLMLLSCRILRRPIVDAGFVRTRTPDTKYDLYVRKGSVPATTGPIGDDYYPPLE